MVRNVLLIILQPVGASHWDLKQPSRSSICANTTFAVKPGTTELIVIQKGFSRFVDWNSVINYTRDRNYGSRSAASRRSKMRAAIDYAADVELTCAFIVINKLWARPIKPVSIHMSRSLTG